MLPDTRLLAVKTLEVPTHLLVQGDAAAHQRQRGAADAGAVAQGALGRAELRDRRRLQGGIPVACLDILQAAAANVEAAVTCIQLTAEGGTDEGGRGRPAKGCSLASVVAEDIGTACIACIHNRTWRQRAARSLTGARGWANHFIRYPWSGGLQLLSVSKWQVAPEGGEEVDKRALLDRLKCSGLGTAVTAQEDRSNVDYMVKNRVRTGLSQSCVCFMESTGTKRWPGAREDVGWHCNAPSERICYHKQDTNIEGAPSLLEGEHLSDDVTGVPAQLLVLDGMPFPLKEADYKVQSVWGIDRYTRRWAALQASW